MKAIVTSGWGLKPQLVIGQHSHPQPGPNDVLVKVHASSVNPKDWKLNYNIARLGGPLLAGHVKPLFGDDLSGEVLAVGHKVRTFQVGDEVYGMDMRLRTAALAEFTAIDQRRIALKPKTLSHTQAAVVPLAALTALQGLRKGKAQAGHKVLIIGASGGVGTFAVQIAKHMGCEVTAVCSQRNAELVQSLGADHIIDYTQGPYLQSAGQFDLVFDVTSYETPASCAPVLGSQGMFISTGGYRKAYLGIIRARSPRAKIIIVESYTDDLNTLREMIDSGSVKVVIDSVFPFDQAQQAYERSKSGRASGKIAIEVAA